MRLYTSKGPIARALGACFILAGLVLVQGHPADTQNLPAVTAGPAATATAGKPCPPMPCPYPVCGGCPKGSHPVKTHINCCLTCSCVPDTTPTTSTSMTVTPTLPTTTITVTPTTTTKPDPTTSTTCSGPIPCPMTICGPCAPGSYPTSTVPPCRCPVCGCASGTAPLPTSTVTTKFPPPIVTQPGPVVVPTNPL
ncbi:hypothetical protein DFP72DRAFT_872976 [Ephemerocybe angulata]|uniref:Uncharacterized protein n=1 Tax=Ephemerocybe angulata TaxID=980116 RepID=A0A8H6IDL9_9AGAR|nr:hypothetical protein DFP72DRAFT_872976 [Tulosesus angulatus]